MKPRIPYPRAAATALVLLVSATTVIGCKASQLTGDGTRVVVLYDEPLGCERLGIVTGVGGGLTGGYTKLSANEEAAENDVRNKAAELGATHVLVHPEQVRQGDAHSPDYQDTQPAMAHGSGTGSTVTVEGTAYKCAVADPQTKTAMSIRSGTTIIAVQEPTSISMAPLGTLKSVSVFRRLPSSTGTMNEEKVLVVEDQAEIQQVLGSLQRVVDEPIKYIPTHRVEFAGELGVQSLLYGFGYLQYAGREYRLTDGAFEEVLRLREESPGPDVETDPPPPEVTSGGEAP